MPERRDDGHKWVGAATIDLPNTVVRMAHKRGTFRLRKDAKVAILEVYCSACMQGYERVNGKSCVALESREHLIGGPIGDQRRRRSADGELEARVAFG